MTKGLVSRANLCLSFYGIINEWRQLHPTLPEAPRDNGFWIADYLKRLRAVYPSPLFHQFRAPGT